ncbi:uncharacterized protein LOC133914568 [Phragmites australis]|uniref:uncharacterized protein LOC133914568 n=1 Tax=Phragmites australis TaxID=29695 RepID=UPI002D77349C|nr:uncharacterized protein LOC133914568 [Phragmites australis]
MELKANQEIIKLLKSSYNSKEALLSDAMKTIDGNSKYQEKLKNDAMAARAERKAMATERDAAIAEQDATGAERNAVVSTLQELKEQTFDHMSQSASVSAAMLLGILKSYNPVLDTSVVIVWFNYITKEAAKLVLSVELVVHAFVESLGLSLPDDDSEKCPLS